MISKILTILGVSIIYIRSQRSRGTAGLNISLHNLHSSPSSSTQLSTTQLLATLPTFPTSPNMQFILSTFLLVLSATQVAAETQGITLHEQYSSSIGVLGCKINIHRVAYWPMSPSCDNICVRVSYNGRSVDLLRIDQSGGAYDISYDAYNYLMTGQSAKDHPITGGAISMDIQTVSVENCLGNMNGGKLTLSAPNSMNFVFNCVTNQPNRWVAHKYQLFNIQDPVCHYGDDEVCSLNLATSNQPSCHHQLSTGGRLPDTVFNIRYGTGKVVPG